MEPVVTFKLYQGRKLINTSTKEYVPIMSLYSLILNNNTFKVFDSKFEKDITKDILIKLLYHTMLSYSDHYNDEDLKELIIKTQFNSIRRLLI